MNDQDRPNSLSLSSVKIQFASIGTANHIDMFYTARSQIPVVGLIGRAQGWPGALKLPGATE